MIHRRTSPLLDTEHTLNFLMSCSLAASKICSLALFCDGGMFTKYDLPGQVQ